ncbi:MAG: hypothetical protein JWR22_814 [Herminiimonas sp.]|nr:hypothetical protein [Herminiimonas sp.]
MVCARFALIALALLPAALNVARAAPTMDAPAVAQATGVPAAMSAAASGPFARPLTLRGKLGDKSIQMRLRPKPQADEGLEGEYFYFGRSAKILLAGEAEGDDVVMEESENGTDVSGQWEGKRQGDSLRGTWTSADGTETRPFDLHIDVDPPAFGGTGEGVERTSARK